MLGNTRSGKVKGGKVTVIFSTFDLSTMFLLHYLFTSYTACQGL